MWTIFAALKTTVTCTLYASVKIGQFIVTTLQVGLTNLLHMLDKLLTLVTVIIEDFTLFMKDVLNNLNNVVSILWMIWERISAFTIGTCQSMKDTLEAIYYGVSTVHRTCINGMLSALNGVKNVFVIFKHIIVMFGDGVWFIVVYLPKATILTSFSALNYLKTELIKLFENIYEYFKNLTWSIFVALYEGFHFLTDLPLESVMGIMIAMCFLYICIQFYNILYVYFYTMICSIFNKIYSIFSCVRPLYNRLKATVQRSLTKRSHEGCHRILESQSAKSSKLSDDAYCIICHDQPKCVLVMPCKHLCMCTECTPRLMRYTGRCPICRKRIVTTMKIFT